MSASLLKKLNKVIVMKFRNQVIKYGSEAVAGGMAAVGSAVNAAPLAAGDFGTLEADIIGTIGVAAAIGVAIMVVGLGWDVGISLVKKFTKKGAS
jgi:hypothetical protein